MSGKNWYHKDTWMVVIHIFICQCEYIKVYDVFSLFCQILILLSYVQSNRPNSHYFRHSQVVFSSISVKSSVQKPIAIKYKSKNGTVATDTNRKTSPVKKSSISSGTLPVPLVAVVPPTRRKDSSSCSDTMGRKSTTPIRGSSGGKRTLTCYICGREFGTASLSLHEPKCLEVCLSVYHVNQLYMMSNSYF